VDVDKLTTICSILCAHVFTRTCILSFHHIFESNRKT
jgi:hypothetical protein